MKVRNAIQARRDMQDRYRAMAVAAARQADAPSHPIMTPSSYSLEQLGFGEQTEAHRTQYEHYTGWPYVAINRIATRLSGLPVHVGRALRPGETGTNKWRRDPERTFSLATRAAAPGYVKAGEVEYAVIEGHAFSKAIERPNELFTKTTLMLVTVASLELTGRGYWWTPRVGGRLQIWHLPSSWVTPVHTEDRMYTYYQVLRPGATDPEKVPAEEVLPFILPDPSDPHGAVSPTQTQAPAIAADEAIQTAQWRSFRNGIHPQMMITMGKHPDVTGMPGERVSLTREQRRELMDTIRTVYEDAVNYGEPLIVDAMIEKVERMSDKIAEMDYLDSGGATKSRIMQAFGVNPFIAGENVTVGWGQASVADESFVSNVVNPLGCLIGEAITAHVRQEGIVVWIEEATPKNPELKLKKYTAALNGKRPCITRNEFRREVLRLPPVDGWDDEDMALQPEQGGDGPELEPEPEQDPSEPPRRPMPGRRFTVGELTKVAATAFERQAEELEDEMARSLTRFFTRAGEGIATRFRAMMEDSPTLLDDPGNAKTIKDEIYRAEDFEAGLREAAFRPLVKGMVTGYVTAKALMVERFRSAGNRQFRGLGEIAETYRKATELTSDEREWLDEWEIPEDVLSGIRDTITETLGAPYWKKILKTTGADVEKVLAAGIAEGKAIHQIAKELTAQVGGDKRRGRRIANTEMTNAMNGGHQEQAGEAERMGFTIIKIWVTIGDMAVREEHMAMAGKEVQGKDGLFDVGGYMVPYPGYWSLPASLRVQCRCTFFTDLAELRNLDLGHDPSSMLPPAWEE